MSPSTPTEVEAVMLLCDSAQSVGGKLYILGGGWSQLHSQAASGGDFPMALAIKVSVPWDRANEEIPLTVRLVTDQGTPVEIGGNEIKAETTLQVGRPAHLKRGTPLDASLALNFAGLPLEPGGYVWNLEAEGEIKQTAPFRVLE